MKSALLLLFTVLLLPASLLGQVSTRVRIVPEMEQVVPGGTLAVAVELKMAPGWHTYWRTPGDAGQATKVVWGLPEGVSAGPLEWPVPETIQEESLTVFAYHGTVRLLSTFSLSSNLPAGPLEFTAKVSWLECEKSCIKGSAVVPVRFVVGGESRPSAEAALVQEARKALSVPMRTLPTAIWKASAPESDEREAVFSFGATEPGELLLDRSVEGQWTARPRVQSVEGRAVHVATFTRFEKQWPSVVTGLWIGKGTDGVRSAQEFSARINDETSVGGLVVAPPPSSVTGGSPTSVDASSRSGTSFGGMLAAAFLGGLILNIMPCVLPVIALKILGFVGQASQQPARVRAMGLVYGAGVLASFLALALLVIGVKAAGGTASWGMQFQNPRFLLVTTAIVLLVALNLFGIFEVILPGAAMQGASDLAGREGMGGAFFNGVLATLLATPCTAPFLGVSLGFALSQSAGTVVLFFLTAGAGLAFPYVLLCWQPSWLRFLPKPGNWMVTFKVAMGFPVLATGLWLFTLTTPHYGADKAFWVAMFLVAVALAAWVFGHFVQHARKSPAGGWIALLVVAGVGYGWFLEKELDWRHPPARTRSGEGRPAHQGPIAWAAWSPEAVSSLRKQGRPVLVDFTADWCTTCQINKRRAIEVPPVVKRIEELRFASLLGDFTFEDPAIAAELKKYRRAGVPLVLVYPADPTREPIVLPDGLLAPADVLGALETAAGKR